MAQKAYAGLPPVGIPETGTSSPTSSPTQGLPTVWWYRQPSSNAMLHHNVRMFPAAQSRNVLHASARVFGKIRRSASPAPLPHSPQQAASTLALLLERSLLDRTVLCRGCAVPCRAECPPVLAASLLCFGVSVSEPCLPPELLSSRLISSDLWGGREWGEARLYS